MRKAPNKWDIEKSTLQNRLGGKLKNLRRDPHTVLTVAEEDWFAEWLIERAKRSFGATKDEFLDCVETFIEKDLNLRVTAQEISGTEGLLRGKVRLRSAHLLNKKHAKITPKEVDEWL